MLTKTLIQKQRTISLGLATLSLPLDCFLSSEALKHTTSSKLLVLLAIFVVYSSAAPVQSKSCEFQCRVGKCVPSSWYCDMVKDCENGKDENDCRYLHDCKPGQYMCKSGECLKAAVKCNGVSDCADGSDERDCSTLQSLHDLPSADDYEHKMQHLAVPPVIVPPVIVPHYEPVKDNNLPSADDYDRMMRHINIDNSGFSWIGIALLTLCLVLLVIAFVVIYFRLWPILCDRLDDLLEQDRRRKVNVSLGLNINVA